jgi:hypothetical protein
MRTWPRLARSAGSQNVTKRKIARARLDRAPQRSSTSTERKPATAHCARSYRFSPGLCRNGKILKCPEHSSLPPRRQRLSPPRRPPATTTIIIIVTVIRRIRPMPQPPGSMATPPRLTAIRPMPTARMPTAIRLTDILIHIPATAIHTRAMVVDRTAIDLTSVITTTGTTVTETKADSPALTFPCTHILRSKLSGAV